MWLQSPTDNRHQSRSLFPEFVYRFGDNSGNILFLTSCLKVHLKLTQHWNVGTVGSQQSIGSQLDEHTCQQQPHSNARNIVTRRYAQRAQTSADPEDPDFGLWTPGSEA